MFKKIKITCNEATTICDKAQYGEASFLEKLKLKLHYFSCKLCRLYSAQNSLLTTIYKRKAAKCKATKHSLTDEDKLILKNKIKEII